jgi:hypothetical protein
MYAQVPGTGKARWQVAQDALKSLMSSGSVSKDASVALRTYGRRKSNDCNDVEVVRPLSRFDPAALVGAVSGIKPVVNAKTPLAASLQAAGKDLQAAKGNTAVILVTDGLETCDGDPVAVAASFVKDAPERKVHVIGFSIADPAAGAYLRQIAASGHGLYFDAGNPAQLAQALRQTVELSYQVVAADGKQAAAGSLSKGGKVDLQAGTYKLKINANPPIEKALVVAKDGRVAVNVTQSSAGLVADVK